MEIYTCIVGISVLVVGVVVHLLYKYIFRRKKYNGITLFEGTLIIAGSVPGLGGCAAGSAHGFGLPLPSLLGFPLNLLFIKNENCGWSQSLIFDDPYLTEKFSSFPIAWLTANTLLISTLLLFKVWSRAKFS
jgi:hypothetical protein